MDYNLLYSELKNLKIKGIGPIVLKKLQILELYTLYDLLYNFPRDYEDRGNVKKIADLVPNEFAIIKGKITNVNLLKVKGNKVIFKAFISDDTGVLELVWFQMPYLRSVLSIGKEVYIFGDVKLEFGMKMVNPEYSFAKIDEGIFPLYNLTKGISQITLRKIMTNVLSSHLEIAQENLPQELLKKYDVLTRKEALLKIHFPENRKDIEDAKRRFAIEELFILQIGINRKRYEIDYSEHPVYEIEDKKSLVKEYLSKLHFTLTNAQKKVIKEIYDDIKKGKIVNRLLQGDVGSGKSVIAFIMLLYMVENGYQGALMAPTEVVAEQHYLNIHQIFKELNVNVELMTGSTKLKEKQDILARLHKGEVDILVGTHALIYDYVSFKNLGLIIIDEQHKFGVNQRQQLREKGIISNLIAMSATPIPRSLALTLYGDLDVSIIDELPPNRLPVATKIVSNKNDLQKAYEFIRQRIHAGEQCYIVCPLVETSEKLDYKAVEEIALELKEKVYPEYLVELLHGRMRPIDKELIIKRFKENKINILVSTTVIEVGVDVPNASVMMIFNAERFGLAQLHQMRGRVGRGNTKSYCLLVSNVINNELSLRRLNILVETNDGFKIAEEDLDIRKPGEIFGTRQSGVSDLRFLDSLKDIKSIKLTRDEAIEYLKRTRGKVENPHLQVDIDKKFKTLSFMN